MTRYIVKPSKLSGTIAIPPSKSQTLRAILFASFASSSSIIRNALISPDSEAMIRCCQEFGAKITKHQNELHVTGTTPLTTGALSLDVGNSGIALRFLSAIAALNTQVTRITGDRSIQTQRSMKEMLSALQQLGVEAVSDLKNGFAPLTIKGPIQQSIAKLGGRDSQPISALLIAGAMSDYGIDLTVTDAGELPWIQITLDWLDRLKISYQSLQYRKYLVAGKQHWEGFSYTVPGDWSSAAFPIAAALVTGSSLSLTNLDSNDLQGDRKILSILKEMGAKIEVNETSIEIPPSQRLKGITVDLNDCIDALPILSTVACFAEGKTTIRNASVAREKECNRINSVQKELSKMGANIQETSDGLIIKGSSLKGTLLKSYEDHRMAMALTVAGLGAQGETVIESVDCVSKTFGNFSTAFRSIGANLKVE